MHEFLLGHLTVGIRQPPIIVAELSGNHNHSLERALTMVDKAADAGAQAIKLQTFTPDTITLNVHRNEFVISNEKSLWYGRSLYELYEDAALPWEWHKPLFERAAERDLIAFSTPFDATSVDFLETLNVPCYKIASFEMTDLNLIRKVAEQGKPMLMSTGMASLEEIAEAVRTARTHGCQDIILLKCTSSYPARPEQANLSTIPHLRDTFGVHVGLSDHTMGVGVAVAGVALGAELIEKHFTLKRSDGGVDSAFSLEPEELETLVHETHNAWAARGRIFYGPSDGMEASEKQNRRSLYFVREKHAGSVVEPEDIRSVRPGLGLPVKDYDLIIGRTLKENVTLGTPTAWHLFV